jgi:hypothetical protein
MASLMPPPRTLVISIPSSNLSMNGDLLIDVANICQGLVPPVLLAGFPDLPYRALIGLQ